MTTEGQHAFQETSTPPFRYSLLDLLPHLNYFSKWPTGRLGGVTEKGIQSWTTDVDGSNIHLLLFDLLCGTGDKANLANNILSWILIRWCQKPTLYRQGFQFTSWSRPYRWCEQSLYPIAQHSKDSPTDTAWNTYKQTQAFQTVVQGHMGDMISLLFCLCFRSHNHHTDVTQRSNIINKSQECHADNDIGYFRTSMEFALGCDERCILKFMLGCRGRLKIQHSHLPLWGIMF